MSIRERAFDEHDPYAEVTRQFTCSPGHVQQMILSERLVFCHGSALSPRARMVKISYSCCISLFVA